MEMWLRFIGITEIGDIIVEKTLLGEEIDVETRTKRGSVQRPWLRNFKPSPPSQRAVVP
jgi:hypothetical protein